MYNVNGVRDCIENVWKLVSKDKYPKLKDIALKMQSIFGNTFVCESAFSTRKQVKSKNRNRIADETLDDNFRLVPLTLVKQRYCQRSLDQMHHTQWCV